MGVCQIICKKNPNQILDIPLERISTRELHYNSDNRMEKLRQYLSKNEKQMIQKIRIIYSVLLNDKLEEIELIRDKFTNRQSKFLAISLKYCNNLLVLNLRNNDLGNEGARLISLAFKFTTQLKKLVIEDNLVRESGVSDISQQLHNLTSLEVLSLSQNIMGNAVETFANSLNFLGNLQELYLQVMDINSNDFTLLSLHLGRCSQLEILGLGHNKMDSGCLRALDIVLRSLKHLKFLVLSGIVLPENDLDEIVITNSNIQITL